MPLDVSYYLKNLGSSVRFRFVIIQGINDIVNYNVEDDINDLASVKFTITNSEYYESIQCTYLIKKKPLINFGIKIKVTAKQFGGYFVERNCLDEESPIYMGIKSRFDMKLGPTLVHNFTITLSASKVENIIEKLFTDTDFTDFQLSTAEGTVAVHKAVLVAHSDVFKTMLSQEWKETAEGCLKLEGITLQTLQHLKQYMYLGTLPDEGLLPLLSIASCYLIENLEKECISKLTYDIQPEDFNDLLAYSFAKKNSELTYNIIMSTPNTVVAEAKEILLKKDTKEEANK